MLDLLEWQWFVTHLAKLCAFCSPHVWGGAGGLLDCPGKGQFRPHMSGDGGGECELFLSQPTPLASGVDGPCSYSTAVLGSARLFPKAVFVSGAHLLVQNMIWW